MLPKLEGKKVKILPAETQLMPFECKCVETNTYAKNLSMVDLIHFTWGAKPWLLEKQLYSGMLTDTKCTRELIAMRRSIMHMASSYCDRSDEDELCKLRDWKTLPTMM